MAYQDTKVEGNPDRSLLELIRLANDWGLEVRFAPLKSDLGNMAIPRSGVFAEPPVANTAASIAEVAEGVGAVPPYVAENEAIFFQRLNQTACGFIARLRHRLDPLYQVYFTKVPDLRIRYELPNRKPRTLITLRWRPQKGRFWIESCADVKLCYACGFLQDQVAESNDQVMNARIILDPATNQVDELIQVLERSVQNL